MAKEQDTARADARGTNEAAAVGRAAVRAHVTGLHDLGARNGHAAVRAAEADLLASMLDLLDAGGRAALSAAVLDHADETCRRQVADLQDRAPSADGMAEADVLDDLATCLDRLAAVLRDHPGDGGQSLDALRTSASAHAAARFGQGFTTGELGLEYALLRRNVMRDVLADGDDARGPRAEALHAAIGELTTAAVVSFAAMREGRARLEAEAMSRFLSSLAHDLRNDLNAAMMSMQLVGQSLGAGGLDPAEAAELARDVGEGRAMIEGTLHTMTRVLEAERMRAGAGAVTLRPRPTDLRPLLLSITRAAGRAAGAGAAAPRIEVECDAGLRVETDPDLLTSVLLNFVGNAIRHAGGDGPIRLVAEAEADGGCVVRVSDTGPGIEPDKLAALFDRFHRGGRGGTGGGLGLGLFIARCAADLLGARVDVQSELGRGSTFSVTLPAQPPPARRGA